MKAIINIHLKQGVLDPAGKATMNSLEILNFNNINDVKIGKQIIINLKEENKEKAQIQLSKMCKDLLVNDVIESYTIEIENNG